MNKTPWTEAELDILRREWPNGGWAAVKDLLPGRSYTMTRGAANRYQIRVVGRSYVQQPANDWTDASIRRAYRDGRPDCVALAKTLGRTIGWVKWRARELGVARWGIGAIGVPGATWTPEELDLLARCVEHNLQASSIYRKFRAAGYRRSLSAIVAKLHQQQWHLDRDWWTALETAEALCVDVHAVLRWIEKGWLRAKRQYGVTSSQQDSPRLWAVTLPDLRAFLIAHPRQWDHRRVPIELLLEVLCGNTRNHGHGLGAFKIEDAA